MSSDRPGSRSPRFDLLASTSAQLSLTSDATGVTHEPLAPTTRLDQAIQLTRDHLLSRQHADGHWRGELEGDTILESEYILLLAFLGRERSNIARQAANYLLQQQLPHGGWAIYPGGPLEISASVKAYFALKLVGHAVDTEPMQRARRAILDAGGAERVNSFTRYYLALLGVIGYDKCPAVPPELMLLPRWMPFNIYEMSAWSRTIVVPLSLLWAFRPQRELAPEQNIRELFLGAPEDLPKSMPPSESLDAMRHESWLPWNAIFQHFDSAIKLLDHLRLRPFRRIAVQKAEQWIVERFADSDGLGAIFPPIIWSVVALRCLGYAEDSAFVQAALAELDALCIREADTIRLEPCKSPVWDTALTTIALREAGVPWNNPAIRNARDWLLSKEVRQPGDWSGAHPHVQPGGWFFEYRNRFYPDVDDTAMVLMALSRCLPEEDGRPLSAELFVDDWSPHEADKDAAAVVAGRRRSAAGVYQELDAATPQIKAMWRGVRWMLAMQCRDGGWGAFDADNNRELFTRVPFADHNAMIDPATADITARVLEMFADLNVPPHHPAVRKGVDFVWREQEADHCWYGRWGVNYIYGTWQVIVGLTRTGISPDDPRIRRAADWLKQNQQSEGGWGETPRSYDEPSLRGIGPATPSQTAWALMGLIAAGQADSDAAARGVQYLLDTQRPDGTWDEPWFTGTGFPRVFYLRYHMYRLYFPLMALAKYRRAAGRS